MIFWIPLEISGSKLKAYTIDYMNTFLCIIMEVNVCKNLNFYLEGIIMENICNLVLMCNLSSKPDTLEFVTTADSG